MTRLIKSSTIFIIAIFVFLPFLFINVDKVQAAADTCTWQGDVSSLWGGGTDGVNTNWTCSTDGNTFPQTGDALVFPAAASNLSNTNTLSPSLIFTSVEIEDAYNMGGNSISISGGLTFDSASTLVYGLPTTLTASQTIANIGAGAVTITSAATLDIGSNATIIDNGGGTITFNGIISGSANITKSGGTSNIVFTAVNDFTSDLFINDGALEITNSNALGTPDGFTLVNSGGTLSFNTGGMDIDDDIIITGTGNVGAGALRNFTGNNIIDGTVTLNGAATIQSDTGNTLTIDGAISAAGGNDLTLNGIIILNGNNTISSSVNFTDATTPVGVVSVNGTNTSTIFNVTGGDLLGTGTLGALTMSDGSGTSRIMPGTNGTIGTISTGAINNTDIGQVFRFDLGTSTSDTINVTGTVTLNTAALQFNIIGSTPVHGQVYTIINNDAGDAIGGTFAGFAEGSTLTNGSVVYTISYVGGTGNDVIMTAAAPNQAPINTVPGTQTLDINSSTQLTFDAGNSNLIDISDVDALTDPVRVTLTITDGTLTLGSTTGLTFITGDGTTDATMTFEGTITDINNALDGLVYNSSGTVIGDVTLTITTSDLGNNGNSGGTLIDTDTITITLSGTLLSDTGITLPIGAFTILGVLAIINLVFVTRKRKVAHVTEEK